MTAGPGQVASACETRRRLARGATERPVAKHGAARQPPDSDQQVRLLDFDPSAGAVGEGNGSPGFAEGSSTRVPCPSLRQAPASDKALPRHVRALIEGAPRERYPRLFGPSKRSSVVEVNSRAPLVSAREAGAPARATSHTRPRTQSTGKCLMQRTVLRKGAVRPQGLRSSSWGSRVVLSYTYGRIPLHPLERGDELWGRGFPANTAANRTRPSHERTSASRRARRRAAPVRSTGRPGGRATPLATDVHRPRLLRPRREE